MTIPGYDRNLTPTEHGAAEELAEYDRTTDYLDEGGWAMFDLFEEINDWAKEKFDEAGDFLSDKIRGTFEEIDSHIFPLSDDDDERNPEYGDVIAVSRGIYDHYGIYISDRCVIHYTSLDSDVASDAEVQETTFKVFLRGQKECFVLNFSERYGRPKKTNITIPNPAGSIIDPRRDHTKELLDEFLTWSRKNKEYTLYSPEETVERAQGRLGEKKYSLPNNNCEHFAIWCKTGISESHQVNDVLKLLKENKRRYVLY